MSSLEATGYLNRGKVVPKIDRSLVLLRVVGHTLIYQVSLDKIIMKKSLNRNKINKLKNL